MAPAFLPDQRLLPADRFQSASTSPRSLSTNGRDSSTSSAIIGVGTSNDLSSEPKCGSYCLSMQLELSTEPFLALADVHNMLFNFVASPAHLFAVASHDSWLCMSRKSQPHSADVSNCLF
eukprot:5409129-Amphidinium_carterae.1